MTKGGGTISNISYYGQGDYIKIPRLGWGVGLSGKTIRTGLCPGGKERVSRLLRLIENGRIDPTLLPFDEVEKAFKIMENKEDGVIKPLVTFE
ncbi:hypothetical protein [Natranaerobius trueperi]|uniref:Alcohol dehydrogenase-like C-terminal domain-containing protein n=1 Tax=Natranaerobius trueperi TaxID=759412 RepID=A0A226BW77_9FIRM|nr:hypothetical protein [Natranaerobius trueperi]OWZ83256.1 hypothetical protein CDO51_09775 [Natranaerobius trueperi]